MSTSEAAAIGQAQIEAMLEVLAYLPQLRDATSITFGNAEESSSSLVVAYTGQVVVRSNTDMIAAVEALGLDPRMLKTITVTRNEIRGVRFLSDAEGRRHLAPNGTEYLKEPFTITLAKDAPA